MNNSLLRSNVSHSAAEEEVELSSPFREEEEEEGLTTCAPGSK